jgi:hypothetical protein
MSRGSGLGWKWQFPLAFENPDRHVNGVKGDTALLDFAIAWDWLTFAARWLHVVTAIAWIGSSFYFIALDLGLRQRPGLPEGAHGEEWQVHGGGFYHIQKYLVAPAEMPEHLTWFKWEAYMTWLSGALLMAMVYYAGADLYLDRPQRAGRAGLGRDPHLDRLPDDRLDRLRPSCANRRSARATPG